jgi:soluble P-type ATPase
VLQVISFACCITAIGDIKLQGLNVSFDYHDTLTTDKGKKLLIKEMDEKNTIYIISAAQHKSELVPFANKYGIPLSRVFATGSNQNKVDKLKELDIVRHYDNSQQVIDIAKETQGLKTEIVKV